MIRNAAASFTAVVSVAATSIWAALVIGEELEREPNPWVCPMESTAVKVVSFLLIGTVWQNVIRMATKTFVKCVGDSTARFERQRMEMLQRLEAALLSRMRRDSTCA